MKRLVQLVARLYPSAWRRRYEAEFQVFLDDITPDWRAVLDVLRGATAMQLRAVSLRKMVALAGVIGLISGLFAWLTMPNQYASMAMLRVRASQFVGGPNSSQLASDEFCVLEQNVLSNKSLAKMIRRHKLYPGEETKLPLEEIAKKMRKSIEVQPAGEDAVSIRFRYNDRAVAQRVTRDLILGFMTFYLEPRATGWPPHLTLMLLDSASLPEDPIAPNPLQLAVIGLFTGIFAGMLFGLAAKAGAKIIF